MARGKRRHPTESLGIGPHRYTVSNKTLPEKNTVHAFGAQGNETFGWPFKATALPGVRVGNYIYREPRLSQDDLGGSRRRRRKKRRR
jgi:hypothetical protein